MNGFERVLAAGVAGGCFASVLALTAGIHGGEQRMFAFLISDPVGLLSWPFGFGTVGGAALGFLRENRG